MTLRGVPVEELDLDFTLPGYPEVELMVPSLHASRLVGMTVQENGSNVKVTLDNLAAYVEVSASESLPWYAHSAGSRPGVSC